MRRRTKWILIVSLTPVVAFLLFWHITGVMYPWSELNCRHQDVDINTGRIRETRYLLNVKLWERTKDSWITTALSPEVVRTAGPDWKRVNTFSPGTHHSPHYTYHGAISQIRLIEEAWQQMPFTKEAQRQVAETLLKLWQKNKGYWAAEDYAVLIPQFAYEAKARGTKQIIRLDDLPPAKRDEPK